MEVSEIEAIAALAERDVQIGEPQFSADRLRKLRPGVHMLFEAPVVMDRLPGMFGSVGRHTEIGPGCDFSLVSTIGSFCTIANDVIIGKAEHPTSFVSVSNIFYADRAPTGFGRKDQRFLAANRNAILDAGRKHNVRNRKPTAIGDDVFIGSRAIIARGVRIGTGAVIGAGAVVVKDVEPYTIVAGVPARPIRKRFPEPIIAALGELRWWKRDFSLLEDIDWTDPEAAVDQMQRRLAEEPARYEREPNVIVLRRNPDGKLNLFKRRKQPATEAPAAPAEG